MAHKANVMTELEDFDRESQETIRYCMYLACFGLAGLRRFGNRLARSRPRRMEGETELLQTAAS